MIPNFTVVSSITMVLALNLWCHMVHKIIFSQKLMHIFRRFVRQFLENPILPWVHSFNIVEWFFEDENYKLTHIEFATFYGKCWNPTSMAVSFFIIGAKSWFNGKHIMFGKVIEGMDVVRKLDAMDSQSVRTSKKIISGQWRMIDQLELTKAFLFNGCIHLLYTLLPYFIHSQWSQFPH